MTNNYITGVCRNADKGKFEEGWPTCFVAVPRIGDYVRNIKLTDRMQVEGITHSICIVPGPELNKPFIIVELKKS